MGASRTPARDRFTSNAPSSEARFLHEAGERLRDAGRTLAIEQARDVRACNEHEVVPGRDVRVQRPEGLSQRSLHRLSLYGAADLAAHGDPQPRVFLALAALPSREGVQDQEPVGMRLALAIDAIEVATARQAPPLAPPARRAGGHGVSRLRPLRRLRLMTCRPLRVRIRARNP